jgi:hypothetical protein
MNNFDENSKSSNKSSENLVKVLKDWIIDIGISEKYYQKKFGKMDKKKINHLDAE